MKLNTKSNFFIFSAEFTHGLIEKSKPQTNYPFNYPFAYNLKVDDIDGCAVGTKNRINKFQAPYELNLNIKDIPGALSGSLKKGIITERNTNPINPNYKYIGEQELGNKFENDPYADFKLVQNQQQNHQSNKINLTNQKNKIQEDFEKFQADNKSKSGKSNISKNQSNHSKSLHKQKETLIKNTNDKQDKQDFILNR